MTTPTAYPTAESIADMIRLASGVEVTVTFRPGRRLEGDQWGGRWAHRYVVTLDGQRDDAFKVAALAVGAFAADPEAGDDVGVRVNQSGSGWAVAVSWVR